MRGVHSPSCQVLTPSVQASQHQAERERRLEMQEGHVLLTFQGIASLRLGGAQGRPVGPSRTGGRDPGGAHELWRVEGRDTAAAVNEGHTRGKAVHKEAADRGTGEGPGRAAAWLGHLPGEAEG